MRPKKKVLICGADEETASVLRIVLDAHGYHVRCVGEEWEAWGDVVLLLGNAGQDGDALQAKIERELAVRVVRVRRRGEIAEGEWICSILQAIAAAVAVRRGPKTAEYTKAKLHARNAADRYARLRGEASA